MGHPCFTGKIMVVTIWRYSSPVTEISLADLGTANLWRSLRFGLAEMITEDAN
jgi:hypothetical protein